MAMGKSPGFAASTIASKLIWLGDHMTPCEILTCKYGMESGVLGFLVSILQNSKLSHFIMGPKARPIIWISWHCLWGNQIPWMILGGLRVSISSLYLCFEVRWNGTHLIGGWALVAFFLGKDIDMCELFCGQGELTSQCRSDGIDCRGLDLLKNRYHDLTTPEGLLEWIPTGELGPFQLCFCVGYAHGSSSTPGLWWPWRKSWGFADLVSFSSGNPCNRWLGLTKLKLARTIYLGRTPLWL